MKSLLEEKEGFLIDFEMFVEMKEALRETFASGANVIVAVMAKHCGEKAFEKIGENAESKEEALNRLCEIFNEKNWGELSFMDVDFERGKGKASVKNSFEARNCKSTTPSCHFLSNFMTGFLSRLFMKKIVVTEEKCAGKGDTHCEFKF